MTTIETSTLRLCCLLIRKAPVLKKLEVLAERIELVRECGRSLGLCSPAGNTNIGPGFKILKPNTCGCRQLGIVDFEPLKPYFLDLLTASQAYLPNLPGLGPITVALDRVWSADDPTKPPTAPALVCFCLSL